MSLGTANALISSALRGEGRANFVKFNEGCIEKCDPRTINEDEVFIQVDGEKEVCSYADFLEETKNWGDVKISPKYTIFGDYILVSQKFKFMSSKTAKECRITIN